MAEYLHPVHIANRALFHCGARLLDETDGFTEDSPQAEACSFNYGKLRRAELRRNIWRFAIRWAILRPVTATTREIEPTMWSSFATYAYGAVVSDAQGVLWQSLRHDNLNNEPGKVYYWELYTGPIAIPAWVDGEGYFVGDVVYKPGTAGTYSVYLSLVEGNTDDPATPNAYDATRQYRRGDLVISSAVVYQSLIDFNTGNTPVSSPLAWSNTPTAGTGSEKWVLLSVALTDRPILVPAQATPYGAGKSVYRYPANYLRKVPEDPKRGQFTAYGGPGNRWPDSAMPEGNYFTEFTPGPKIFRFVADIQNVQEFDDMFCEGLAARLALAIAPKVTQDEQVAGRVAAEYSKWMSEARTVNAIEVGAVEAVEDEYITCRY